ncbi:MAG: rod shape-determining protein MreD [Acidaminococcaceae bacterium]|jgi:rod shape-determining protein MreD|nr:rod shape-determining protein MreD [Acidaminococcaceae bacterium]
MNRRLWAWLLAALVFLLLQSTSFGTFTGSVWFDLPLLFVYSVAMLRGAKAGAVCGLLLGLIQDIFTANVFGFHLLTRTLLGFGCGSIKEIVYRTNYHYHALFVFCLSLAVRALFIIPQYFLAGGWEGWLPYYAETALAYAFTNAVLAFPVGWLMVRLDRWIAAGDLSY